MLLWISYIVMLSLYAYAFGSYGASFFRPDSQFFWQHVLITGSVLAITGLNLLNAKLIGEAEDWIVLLKVIILLLFIGVGIWQIDSARLAPTAWSSPLHLIAGGMIIFLTYEGFELIANTARDVARARKLYYCAMCFRCRAAGGQPWWRLRRDASFDILALRCRARVLDASPRGRRTVKDSPR